MKFPKRLSLLACILTTPALAIDVGSQGYQNFTTDAFVLEIDKATQVATRLTALPGSNAGTKSFNFLLPTSGRAGNGNYFLGDIQLRYRDVRTSDWVNVSSHFAREAAKASKIKSSALATADITSSLGKMLPITVSRSWSMDNDSIVLHFNITNTGRTTLEIGGLGIPLPYNNDWIGKDQTSTWTESVVSDPAMSLDAGYVLTNRLTGESPTLVTAPVGKTPLEQYRLNVVNQPSYPLQWLDKAALDYNYEGIFSWWTSTAGLTDLDNAAASSYGFSPKGQPSNTPTSTIIRAHQSHIVALRFFTATGPRNVEDRLTAFGRPTIVGVPGFVAGAGEAAKLVIRSTSAPSITQVSPPYIDFGSPHALSTGVYAIGGVVKRNVYGRTRVTINFANGDRGTAHYSVIQSAASQLDSLGEFRFENQWFTNTSDYFKRGPSIISYDNKKKQQILDDSRAWIAGLSDEAGSGAYVSSAAKQFGRPSKAEIAKLEQFATTTLFGVIQHKDAGSTYAGVKKSIFYYDESLTSSGVYDPTIDHSGTWPPEEANLLTRSYNYPHPCVVYWTLYRLARNYVGLTSIPWHWYLDRAYDTIMAMQKLAGIEQYAKYGLMEGSYFTQILKDLKREGARNSTLSGRANHVESFMKQRADLWNSQTYPYASEFPWDNTGQEEVYFWSSYFGYNTTAQKTIETLMAVMSSVPDWTYSGVGRDLWDFQFSGQAGPGARLERVIHHYKGAQSAYPLVTQFQSYPTDIHMLRAGYGGVLGPLTSIGADGFGSTGFHSRPDYLEWDPLSGDNGVNIALHALSTRAVLVNDKSLGGWAGFGATVTQSRSSVNMKPTDSTRQRIFIAENALYLELDAGKFASVSYDLQSRAITVTFDANDGYTPNARIRWMTTASTPYAAQYSLEGRYNTERECSVVPLSRTRTTTVKLVPKSKVG